MRDGAAVTPTAAPPLFSRMKRFVYPEPVGLNVENHGDCRIVALADQVAYGAFVAPVKPCTAPTAGFTVPARLNDLEVPSETVPVAPKRTFATREVPTGGKLAAGIVNVAGPPAGTAKISPASHSVALLFTSRQKPLTARP